MALVTMMLSVLIAAGALIAYIMVEKRINQRACSECGFTISLDAIEEQCPNCDALLGEIDSPRTPSRLDY